MGRHSANRPDETSARPDGIEQPWQPAPRNPQHMLPCNRCGAAFAAHIDGRCPQPETATERVVAQQWAAIVQTTSQPSAPWPPPPGSPPSAPQMVGSKPLRHKWVSPKKFLFGLAVVVLLLIIVAKLGQPSQQSSLSSQADAVMQLNDTPFDVTQSPGSGAIQVINSAAKAFNAAVTVTNDPTQQDNDYTNIGYDLGQVQQDIQASNWMQYYTDLGQARSDIQSARADGTLSGP